LRTNRRGLPRFTGPPSGAVYDRLVERARPAGDAVYT
jgi:hypothetical protein